MFSNLHWITLGIGSWVTLSGILHTIAILNQHKGEYNRDLLRLLMDGMILVTCGGIQILSFRLIEDSNVYGFIIVAFTSVMLIIYCFLIWKFLRSVFTLVIESGLLLLTLISIINV